MQMIRGMAFCALALLAVGCDRDGVGTAGPVAVIDTLASGAVRVRSPAHPPEGSRPWSFTESLRIGSVESGGPEQFGQIRDVTVDRLGRLYVLEGQAKEVRVFEPNGTHVRTLGREGEGPGELGGPIELEWGPDGALWIVDFRNRRYEVFDTTGVRVAGHPFPSLSFGFGNMWSDDGQLHERLAGTGERRRPATLRRRLVDGELSVVDTLPVPEIPPSETVEATVSSDGGSFTMGVPIPLQLHAVRTQGPDGDWWVSDAGEDYRIVRLDERGDTVRIVERDYEPVPVTDEAWARALEQLPEGVTISADRRPDVHPPISTLLPGTDGLLVRRRTGPAQVGYDAFDDRGRYVGEVETDVPLEDFDPMEWRGDALYGTLTDELDVPYVVRLVLER